MRRRFVRRAPKPVETVSAALATAVVAVGVGAVTFYLTRAFLARDAVASGREPEATDVTRR